MMNRGQRDLLDAERAIERREAGRTERGLPASKRYKVNPQYSRTPTGICENTTMGLPVCQKGEDKYCYFRGLCVSQCESIDKDENGNDIPKKSKEVERLCKKEYEAALRHSREVMKNNPDLEREYDNEIDEMIRRILS